jgi:putative hydrolase of the HAD superfamily
MITTVVFDLDDTLYDELDYCRSGFKTVAQSLSNIVDVLSPEEIFDSLWKQFTAGNHAKTFNAVLEDLGLGYDDRLIEKLIETYRTHKPEIKLPEDSANVLQQLSKKYTLALLTDGFLPSQQLKLQALKIEKYFKCIIYTEQLGRQFWKPSPVGFERLMQILNAEPQTMAYVADNEEKDFIAPNQLGFVTIQIVRPARLHKLTSNAPNALAKHVIPQITQLPTLLEKL